MTVPSKTQIDRLGDRIRKRLVLADDLKNLDAYRLSFSEAYEAVVNVLREQLKLDPTGRPAKSTKAIADKLQRESIRLTQVQDIAGCRIVVRDIAEQNRVAGLMNLTFTDCTIVDRRTTPSHGYRAIHAIVTMDGKPVEIQIRTERQHRWAEISEKFADTIDPRIKYGSGPAEQTNLLMRLSGLIAELEVVETQSAAARGEIAELRRTLASMVWVSHPQLRTDLASDISEKDAFQKALEFNLADLKDRIDQLLSEIFSR